MTRFGVVFLSVIGFLGCGSPGSRSNTRDPGYEPEEMEEPERRDAAASGKQDARVVVAKDVGDPAPRPDSASAPTVDAAPPAGDAATTSPDTGTGSGGDDGGGTPLAEAKWSHTMCNQRMLMYPNIDKNMGRFPPGSCPPPETLARPCGGNSKIAIMTATSSGHETGYVHPPSYAIDQYLMTRWSSPGSMATAWLSLDLGSEQSFKRIYLAWELSHASDYDVVVSNDGTTWTMLKQVRGGNGYQDILDVEGKARHVRINGLVKGKTDTGGVTYGYSIFDVVICGERP
jgi:hypothetical protein